MLFFIFLFVLPCLYLISLCLWHGVSLYFVTYHSGVPDLKYLRQPRKNGKIDGTAVICGGSIAGLLTAKICETHFKRVIIVEPEAWLATEEGRRLHGWGQTQHRSRVMQYKSLQGNQSTILAGLTALFPDFKEEVVKSGMRIGPGDFKTTFAGTAVKLPTIYLGQDLPNTIFTSRQGLETLIRRLVLGKTSSIEHIIGTVTGLSVDPNDPSRISHVTVRTDDGPIEVEAALVADCTGVTRAGIKWLERLGFGKTSEGGIPLKSLKVSLDQKLQYTSIMVSLSPELHQRLPIPGGLERAQAVYTFLEDQPTLGRRFFVITKPEGDQILLFGGQSSDSSPGLKTIEDMIDYAKSMVTFRDPIPHWVFEIMELLKEHEEVKSVSQIRVPGTSYIRYHMASQLPSNFVAVGDSVMSVNPTFAQGCSKAFLGALSLNNALRKVKASTLPPNFSRKFFAEHCAKTDHYWQTTKLMDYGIPTTIPIPGEDLSSGASIRSYIRRMQILAITDDHAALAMYNSALGLGTPFDPFHPNLMVKILWDVIRRPAL